MMIEGIFKIEFGVYSKSPLQLRFQLASRHF